MYACMISYFSCMSIDRPFIPFIRGCRLTSVLFLKLPALETSEIKRRLAGPAYMGTGSAVLLFEYVVFIQVDSNG